jgi:hypothetical protein
MDIQETFKKIKKERKKGKKIEYVNQKITDFININFLFNIKWSDIEKKFGIKYQTIWLYNKQDNYKKRIIEFFRDYIILKPLIEENLKQFTNKELKIIEEAIKNFIFTKSMLQKDNEYLKNFLKNNEILKEIVEKEMLTNNLNLTTFIYKISKLDKLDKYYLLKKIFDETMDK